MSGDREIAVPKPLGIPMIPIEDLKKLTAYVNQVKEALMKKGQDYVIERGRQYTARSGFAKLAQGFNLSDDKPEIVILQYQEPTTFKFTHYIKGEAINETITTHVKGFEALVRVVNLESGRYGHGEGACTVEELHQTRNMSPKWYHRCLATAKTRAWNRAVSNYVGSAEVSAEEMGLNLQEEGTPKDERRKVDADYELPEDFKTPDWDFTEALRADGWDKAEVALIAWIGDSGMDLQAFESPESDAVRMFIRPKAYFGKSFGPISKMLAAAGLKWRSKEKRWGLLKPEGVS